MNMKNTGKCKERINFTLIVLFDPYAVTLKSNNDYNYISTTTATITIYQTPTSCLLSNVFKDKSEWGECKVSEDQCSIFSISG